MTGASVGSSQPKEFQMLDEVSKILGEIEGRTGHFLLPSKLNDSVEPEQISSAVQSRIRSLIYQAKGLLGRLP